MAPLLTGQGAYYMLSNEEADYYCTLKEELLTCYGLSST